MKILKFKLEIASQQTIFVPQGAKFLTVQVQKGILQLWAMCEDNSYLESRKIDILTTGVNFDSNYNGKYIATVQMDDGDFVAHVFESGTV